MKKIGPIILLCIWLIACIFLALEISMGLSMGTLDVGAVVEWGIILMVSGIYLIITIYVPRKLFSYYQTGEYELLLSATQGRLFRILPGFYRQYAYYLVALSSFEVGDGEAFIQNMFKVQHRELLVYKYFWLSIYGLMEGTQDMLVEAHRMMNECANSDAKALLEHKLSIAIRCVSEKRVCTPEEKATLKDVKSVKLRKLYGLL